LVPVVRDGNVVGFRVYGIKGESSFARAGLEDGDAILRLDGAPVRLPADALRMYERIDHAQAGRIEIERRHQVMTLQVR
jgi:general secretion pathway protein C